MKKFEKIETPVAAPDALRTLALLLASDPDDADARAILLDALATVAATSPRLSRIPATAAEAAVRRATLARAIRDAASD